MKQLPPASQIPPAAMTANPTLPTLPTSEAGPAAESDGPSAPAAAEPALYDRTFWLVYASNMTLMVAVALLYRYADLVTFLGGDELLLGWIVGVGTVGSLAMRFAQGVGIDRYGPRRIWLVSMVLFVLSLLGHLTVTNLGSPWIWTLRILYSISTAGVFGSSITYVSRRLPVAHMAEVIGALGTSGFIGMALGPLLGDFFRRSEVIERDGLRAMFLTAAALGMASLACAVWATRDQVRPAPRRSPPALWLLWRYHPGAVLLMSAVMGLGFALPTVFLPTFAAQLGIESIGGYFLVYSTTAFAARVLTRRFPHHVGVRVMVHLGMAALVVSLLSYLVVRSSWQLVAPGFFGGIAHALLFPAIVASGAGAFPARYRGLGTTVILAMFDIGTLVGAPFVGGLLQASRALGLPPYPTTFVTVALGMTAAGVFYELRDVRRRSG
jgi:MFS family permease